MKMKNFTKIILTAALAAFFTGQVLAQAETSAASDNQTAKQTTTQVPAPGKFIDNNNDGICDNRETMQVKGTKGRNFVDVNNDGICDHRGEGNRGNGNPDCRKGQGNGYSNGMGHQHRHRAGNQHCRNWNK